MAELNYESDDLFFSASGPEVDYYAPSGKLRQIFAPEALADVIDTSATDDTYEIRFYDWTQVGTKSGNIYPVTGSPFVTYQVSKTAAGELGIAKTSGGSTWNTRLKQSGGTWTLYDWTLGGSETTQCLRQVVTTVSSAGSYQYADTIEYGRNASGSLIQSSRSRLTRHTFTWGKELIKIERGYGQSYVQTTTFDYYLSPGDGLGHYSKLWRITRPDGGQTKYSYYDDFSRRGLVSERLEPFEDDNGDRKITYTYTLDVTGHSYVVDVESRFIDSSPIGKTDYDYTAETWNGQPVRRILRKDFYGPGDSDKLETTIRNYREDAGISHYYRRSLPLSVRRPDGTQTSYACGKFGSVYVFEQLNGTSSVPSGETYLLLQSHFGGAEDIDDLYVVDKKSVKLQTNKDAAGRAYAIYEGVGQSSGAWQLMAEDSFTYEPSAGGRLEKHRRRGYANGSASTSWNTLYESDHVGVMLSWSKDQTGEKTTLTYDKQGRVSVAAKEAVAAHSVYPAVGALYERLGYDGSDRLISSSTGDSATAPTESLAGAWSYDLAGRLTARTLEGVSHTYQYPSAASFPTQVKQLNPDYESGPNKGYVLTTHYRDGSVNSVTGDGAAPGYNRSRVLSDLLEKWSARTTFSVGTKTDGWRIGRYDWLGRLVELEEPTYDGGSRFTRHEYSSKGQLQTTRVRQASGSGDLIAPYRYEYDVLGRVLKEGLDVGAGGTLVDNSTDRMTKTVNAFFKDPSGYWWAEQSVYAYPVTSEVRTHLVRRRVAGPENELGRSTTEDAFGNTVTETVTVDRSKAFVTVTSQADPSPTNPARQYLKAGLLVQTVDTAGVVTDYGYDHLRRKNLTVGRDDVASVLTYISGTNRTKEVFQVDASSVQHEVLEYQYNTSGRVSRRIERNTREGSAKDEIFDFTYNKLGQVTYESGSGAFPLVSEYDLQGRLVLQHQYRDTSGTNKTSVAWKYQNPTGLLLEKKHITNLSGYLSNPDNTANYQSSKLQYNDLGQVSRRTWARGNYTDYGYEMGTTAKTGDLLTETHSDLTSGVTYTYDRMSRIKTVADVTGTRTFNYTEYAGLKLDSEDLPDGFYGSANLNYNYEDPSNNSDDYIHGRFKDVRFNGVVWMEKYQEATGRPAAHIAAKAGEYPRTYTFSYTWDSDSNHLEKVSEGSYSQERYYESWRETREKTYTKWGAAYRTKYETAQLTPQHQYESYVLRRPDNDSLAAKYGAGSAITFSFKYDLQGQVKDFTSSFAGLNASSYSYDTAGNRTVSKDINSANNNLNYTVNALNQIFPSGSTVTYDLDGNLTDDGVWLYTWDANNRPATVKKKAGGQFLRFAYDYQGRRVEKKVYNNSDGSGTPSTHLKYLYNAMELLVELKGSDNSILKTFHWGLDKTDTRGGGGGTEGLLLLRDWAAHKSYLPSYDMNGNLVGLLDDQDNGKFAAWYAYDAFGNVTKRDTSTGTYAVANPIRFACQYTDEETGLVNFGYRLYSPRLGRFLNRDPIGESGGTNLYRYAGNDPVNSWDVWGLTKGETTAVDEVPPRNNPRDIYDVRYRSYWDTHSYTYPEDEIGWMEDYYEENGPVPDGDAPPAPSLLRTAEWNAQQRAQRGQDAPFEFSQSVDRLAKLIEEAISVAGMERVGTVVVRINIGDIGPEGGYALQPLTVTVQNESFGIYGQRTHVFATTLYGRFDTEKVTLYGFFLNPRTRGTMLRREAEYLLETLISVEVRADHETDYTHFLATRAEGNYSFPLEPENEVGRTKVIDFRRLDD